MELGKCSLKDGTIHVGIQLYVCKYILHVILSPKLNFICFVVMKGH